MSKRRIQPNRILELIEEGHTETLQKTDRLEEVLTNLRYEGKSSLGKNLREARELFDFFNEELIEHIAQEDEILFPFLKIHLPKLESVIGLLQAEHEDFRKKLEGFKFLLGEVKKEDRESERVQLIEKIREQGTYLIYLLRHHIRAETEVIYKVAERELRPDEKEGLARQLREHESDGGAR